MKFTTEELEFFEAQSRENIVWFYQSELRKILKGQKTMDVLPKNVRKRLKKYGIIAKRPDTSKGSVYYITPVGKKILRSIRS